MKITVERAITNLKAGTRDAGMIPSEEYTPTLRLAIKALDQMQLAKDMSFNQIDIPDCVFLSEEARRVGFTKRSFFEAGWRKVTLNAEG